MIKSTGIFYFYIQFLCQFFIFISCLQNCIWSSLSINQMKMNRFFIYPYELFPLIFHYTSLLFTRTIVFHQINKLLLLLIFELPPFNLHMV